MAFALTFWSRSALSSNCLAAKLWASSGFKAKDLASPALDNKILALASA